MVCKLVYIIVANFCFLIAFVSIAIIASKKAPMGDVTMELQADFIIMWMIIFYFGYLGINILRIVVITFLAPKIALKEDKEID